MSHRVLQYVKNLGQERTSTTARRLGARKGEPLLAALTASGLAMAAGLNAFIPLVALGLLARYTEGLALPPGWEWLTNGWVLMVLSVLLILDVIADKVPAVDHLNDLLHTLIRPASGGLVFTAGAGATTMSVTDPAEFVGSKAFGAFVVGLLIALAVHLAKAAIRAVVNLTTSGLGAPVASTMEETGAVALSVAAILMPVLVLVVVVCLVIAGVWWVRRWRRRKQTALTG